MNETEEIFEKKMSKKLISDTKSQTQKAQKTGRRIKQ